MYVGVQERIVVAVVGSLGRHPWRLGEVERPLRDWDSRAVGRRVQAGLAENLGARIWNRRHRGGGIDGNLVASRYGSLWCRSFCPRSLWRCSLSHGGLWRRGLWLFRRLVGVAIDGERDLFGGELRAVTRLRRSVGGRRCVRLDVCWRCLHVHIDRWCSRRNAPAWTLARSRGLLHVCRSILTQALFPPALRAAAPPKCCDCEKQCNDKPRKDQADQADNRNRGCGRSRASASLRGRGRRLFPEHRHGVCQVAVGRQKRRQRRQRRWGRWPRQQRRLSGWKLAERRRWRRY